MHYQDNLRSLIISWEIDSTRSPQLFYFIEIFYASNNSLAKIVQDSAAHQRTADIDTSDLERGKYHVHLSIQDIFDQMSKKVTSSFFITTNAIIPNLIRSNIQSSFSTQLISGKFALWLVLPVGTSIST